MRFLARKWHGFTFVTLKFTKTTIILMVRANLFSEGEAKWHPVVKELLMVY